MGHVDQAIRLQLRILHSAMHDLKVPQEAPKAVGISIAKNAVVAFRSLLPCDSPT